MKGFILETSQSLVLIANAQRETITSFCYLEGGKNLTKTLFPKIQESCQLNNLDYIAVGIGPGSYIGLRTGATIAQTLAFALNLPLLCFPSTLPLNEIPSYIFPKALEGLDEAGTIKLAYN